MVHQQITSAAGAALAPGRTRTTIQLRDVNQESQISRPTPPRVFHSLLEKLPFHLRPLIRCSRHNNCSIPGAGQARGTSANGSKFYTPGCRRQSSLIRPGIVCCSPRPSSPWEMSSSTNCEQCFGERIFSDSPKSRLLSRLASGNLIRTLRSSYG